MKAIHKVVFILVILTALIVQLYWVYGDTRVYIVSPDSFIYETTDDSEQRGSSVSNLVVEDQKAILNCELVETDQYEWPYCGISIKRFIAADEGINLEKYHTARLNIDFEQLDPRFPPNPSMRFYLRNYNSAYSSAEDAYTLKFNGIEYTPGIGNGSIDVPLSSMQVMTWWLVDNQIPVRHAAPEFSNITLIEFVTGTDWYSGQYKMTINSIEFIGSYISGETLMLCLLVVWVGLGLIYSISELRRSQKLVLSVQQRQGHLKEMNERLRQKNVEFAELAHRDALTGAMNRHAIRDWLNREYHGEHGKALSVIYLDIDFFKQINDKYGHAMGDDILREFTMVVLTQLRSDDHLVRWGGEEFVVFCPDLVLDEVVQVAEDIRGKVETHHWVHGDKLTTSLGVASLKSEGTTEMLTRADEALYQAKTNGRNRVEISS